MVQKKEGATMECRSCGSDLTCRTKDYGGNYKSSLQWQNEDGTAHYKTTNGKDFTCNIPEGEEPQKKSGETPKVSDYIPNSPSLEAKIDSLDNKVERIYAMISEQYRDYIDRKGNATND